MLGGPDVSTEGEGEPGLADGEEGWTANGPREALSTAVRDAIVRMVLLHNICKKTRNTEETDVKSGGGSKENLIR